MNTEIKFGDIGVILDDDEAYLLYKALDAKYGSRSLRSLGRLTSLVAHTTDDRTGEVQFSSSVRRNDDTVEISAETRDDDTYFVEFL